MFWYPTTHNTKFEKDKTKYDTLVSSYNFT